MDWGDVQNTAKEPGVYGCCDMDNKTSTVTITAYANSVIHFLSHCLSPARFLLVSCLCSINFNVLNILSLDVDVHYGSARSGWNASDT